MNTKVCYFCNSILDIFYHCQICQDKYDINGVVYVYGSNDDDAHDYIRIAIDINEIHYHVLLIFYDYIAGAPINETRIYGACEYITTLPGHPLTPANIRDKLKTYLIFS
jgi:hypothetical protein